MEKVQEDLHLLSFRIEIIVLRPSRILTEHYLKVEVLFWINRLVNSIMLRVSLRKIKRAKSNSNQINRMNRIKTHKKLSIKPKMTINRWINNKNKYQVQTNK